MNVYRGRNASTSVEKLRELPEDERHLRRGARVSVHQDDCYSKSRSRRVSRD